MGLFFPAQVDFGLNVRAESPAHPGVTLVNREGVTLRNGSAKEFPPRTADFTATGPIELVDVNDVTGPALVVIDRLQLKASHVPGAVKPR